MPLFKSRFKFLSFFSIQKEVVLFGAVSNKSEKPNFCEKEIEEIRNSTIVVKRVFAIGQYYYPYNVNIHRMVKKRKFDRKNNYICKIKQLCN